MRKLVEKILKCGPIYLLLLFFCRCSNDVSIPTNQSKSSKDSIIYVDLLGKKENDLCVASMIADTIFYVPLETTAESIFGNVLLYAFNDSQIFVSDRKKILSFHRDGTFIGQIGKRGRGPNEILDIFNFSLYKDTVYISSQGKFGITKYTTDGQYQGFVNQSFQMNHFSSLDDKGYVWYDRTFGNIVFFNRNWQMTDTLCIENNVSSHYRQIWPANSSDNFYFQKYKRDIFFKTYRNDTVWNITQKSKNPAIIFNLGRRLLPDNLQIEEIRDGNKFKEKAQQYKRINFMQTDSFIFIIQRNWSNSPEKPSLFVYSKPNKKTYHYYRTKIYDDIKGNIELPIFFYSDGMIISMLGSNQIKQAFDETNSTKVREFWQLLMSKVEENGNPVLVFIKTK